MGLTVTEKEHWKERIARRIDHAIEELQAKQDPGFTERVAKEATVKAWQSIGLKKLHDEEEAITTERKTLDKRQQDIWQQMAAVLSLDVNKHHVFSRPLGVLTAVNQRKVVHEKELLKASPLGQKILQLEAEKEELLDTVWLATSSTQIKELWGRFTEVLAWEPPEMQKDALKIQAVDE